MLPSLSYYHILLPLLSLRRCLAQNDTAETEKLPTFDQPINVLGAMERTDQDFADGLALDLFSPKNRTLVVSQNKSPLPGNFVTGSNGEPFVALQNFSYVIKMNETANDLVGAKVEVPYDPVALSMMGIQEANTYVGKLAGDNMSWVIDEQTRNVHRSENVTRIIKMTSLDGEYILLGRMTEDTSNIFVQYGQGESRTVNVTGGVGRQEAEFIDGLRFSMVAEKDVRMNVDLKNGVPLETLAEGMVSLNTFAWVINTSDPNVRMNTVIKVPFNRNILVAMRPGGSSASTMLAVARRPLNATANEKFQIIDQNKQVVNELPEDRLTVRGIQQIDGEYILLVTPPKPVGNTPMNETEARGYKRIKRQIDSRRDDVTE